jgi:hypothetical protein
MLSRIARWISSSCSSPHCCLCGTRRALIAGSFISPTPLPPFLCHQAVPPVFWIVIAGVLTCQRIKRRFHARRCQVLFGAVSRPRGRHTHFAAVVVLSLNYAIPVLNLFFALLSCPIRSLCCSSPSVSRTPTTPAPDMSSVHLCGLHRRIVEIRSASPRMQRGCFEISAQERRVCRDRERETVNVATGGDPSLLDCLEIAFLCGLRVIGECLRFMSHFTSSV